MTDSINRLKEKMENHGVEDHPEGKTAKKMEEQTAKLPSDVWLWAAVATMGVSLVLKVANRKDDSHFVGQWAAPLLLVGVYNKIVKVAGSDSRSRPR